MANKPKIGFGTKDGVAMAWRVYHKNGGSLCPEVIAVKLGIILARKKGKKMKKKIEKLRLVRRFVWISLTDVLKSTTN